jgi:hypothetical protein
VTAAFAEYPPILRYGWIDLAQMKLKSTPSGMTRSTILLFTVFIWAAPLLLPIFAWLAGRFMNLFVHYALDLDVDRTQVVRVTAYGLLPLALERIVVGALRIGCHGGCDVFNPLAANLAFFLPSKSMEIFWYELARGVDLFWLWAVVVVCLGVAELTERRPAELVFPAVFVWVVATVGRAALLG